MTFIWVYSGQEFNPVTYIFLLHIFFSDSKQYTLTEEPYKTMGLLSKFYTEISGFFTEFFASEDWHKIQNNKWTIALGLLGTYCAYKLITWPRWVGTVELLLECWHCLPKCLVFLIDKLSYIKMLVFHLVIFIYVYIIYIQCMFHFHSNGNLLSGVNCAVPVCLLFAIFR